MTAPNASPFSSWHSTLPIPWLVAGPNGQAESLAWPAYLDALLGQLLAARYASFPGRAPVDALAHIGGDRGIEQGPTETNASFVIRLKDAWAAWSRAGTAVELLAELYYGGFPGAVIAQQNGLLYNLTGAPTPGVDPTPLLNIALAAPNWSMSVQPSYTVTLTCTFPGNLGAARFSAAVNGVTVATNIQTVASTTGALIPVVAAYTWIKVPSVSYAGGDYFTLTPDGGSVAVGGLIGALWNCSPWWTVDADNSHTSRFVVLFPASGGVLSTSTTVTFLGTEDGTSANPWPTATWPTPYSDVTYRIQCGPPLVTDGSGMVAVAADATTQTPSSVQIMASGSFAGTVDVLAYRAGANPFWDLKPYDLARIRRLIARWRPAKAVCASIFLFPSLPVWGYPINTVWGGAGLAWGVGSSIRFTGA